MEPAVRPTHRRGTLALLLAASLGTAFGPASTGLRSTPEPVDRPPAGSAGPSLSRWEHRYRVSGRVWVVFWISRENVGSARMTRRREGGADSISFLGGSDPRRAPNNLNQWGYAVEDASGRDVLVFVIRSIAPTDANVPEAGLADGAEPGLFGASCTAVGGERSRASITGIRVPPSVTFRSFPQLVEALSGASRWETSEKPRPSGAFPGFFSAVMDSIDDSVARASAGVPQPRVTLRRYIFKGTLFDLTTRNVERAGPDLLRGKYTYRNRTTGDDADFSITFGTRGDLAGVPVEMVFQPSWWARVQLRLDDSVDVPEDPVNDRGVYDDISRICGRVLGFSSPIP